jgi:uncharacterized Ntn-hydrolase superfamily protein
MQTNFRVLARWMWLFLWLAMPCAAQERASDAERHDDNVPGAERWISTFSIIAFDPATNQLGVGVQSRAFGAGAIVPCAKAGVGAVATQAAANRTYGPKAIALLEQGLSPEEVIKRITSEDPQRDRRQVAVIDAKGRSAVYTGKHVIDRNHDPKDHVHFGGWAGHVQGEHFSAQGNTLASEAVVLAMAEAYKNGTGTMAERLMDALEAGQSKGGDTRGMQAAGILVVQPITGPEVTIDRVVDLRVDDAPNPYIELRRLLNIRLSGTFRQRALDLARQGKRAEALEAQKTAVAMHPRSEQLQLELAERYAEAGDTANALLSLQRAIAIHPYVKRMAVERPAFVPLKDSAEFKQLISQ